jgi:hypothetical protein
MGLLLSLGRRASTCAGSRARPGLRPPRSGQIVIAARGCNCTSCRIQALQTRPASTLLCSDEVAPRITADGHPDRVGHRGPASSGRRLGSQGVRYPPGIRWLTSRRALARIRAAGLTIARSTGTAARRRGRLRLRAPRSGQESAEGRESSSGQRRPGPIRRRGRASLRSGWSGMIPPSCDRLSTPGTGFQGHRPASTDVRAPALGGGAAHRRDQVRVGRGGFHITA